MISLPRINFGNFVTITATPFNFVTAKKAPLWPPYSFGAEFRCWHVARDPFFLVEDDAADENGMNGKGQLARGGRVFSRSTNML